MSTTLNQLKRWTAYGFIFFSFTFASCGADPEPVNEEEVITTFSIVLTPSGSGSDVLLKFYDLDGDGSGAATTTVSGPMIASRSYSGSATLLNEAANPSVSITHEILEEGDAHLLCYTVTDAAITITPTDKDSNNLPLGLETTWQTGAAGTGTVKVMLRHQPGTKTGACPGSGDTDVEVTFNVQIQ